MEKSGSDSRGGWKRECSLGGKASPPDAMDGESAGAAGEDGTASFPLPVSDAGSMPVKRSFPSEVASWSVFFSACVCAGPKGDEVFLGMTRTASTSPQNPRGLRA